MWVSFHGVGPDARETVVGYTHNHGSNIRVLDSSVTFSSLCVSSNVLYLTQGHSWFFPWTPGMLCLRLSSLSCLVTNDPLVNSSWTTVALKHRPRGAKADRDMLCPAKHPPPGVAPVIWDQKTAKPREPVSTVSLEFCFVPEHFQMKLWISAALESLDLPLAVQCIIQWHWQPLHSASRAFKGYLRN